MMMMIYWATAVIQNIDGRQADWWAAAGMWALLSFNCNVPVIWALVLTDIVVPRRATPLRWGRCSMNDL